VDGRRKSADEVARGDDRRTRIEEEVLEASMSASNKEKRTIRKAAGFRKQPAKVDPIENATSNLRSRHVQPVLWLLTQGQGQKQENYPHD